MTLAQYQARLALYIAAEASILKGQEYRIRDGVIDRWLRKADLDMVRAAITDINLQIATLTTTRRILYIR